MKHMALLIVWVLTLSNCYYSLASSSQQDYSRSSFDLSGDVLTQVFRRSEDSVQKGREDHHTCKTWGKGIFKKFNNEISFFNSNCDIVMSRLCSPELDFYEVKFRRGSDNNLEHIFIKIETTIIVVNNGVISVKNKTVTLPYNDKVIKIHSNGINIRITNKKNSVSLLWNGNDALSLKLHPRYSERVCGLCGNFDKKENNEETIMQMTEATILKESASLASCEVNVPEIEFCPEANKCRETISRHLLSCENSESYIGLCILEICTSPRNPSDLCPTLQELASQCMPEDIVPDWRKTSGCGVPNCPGNQIYNDAGQPIIPTCTHPDPQQIDAPESTCECPEGTVLDNIRRKNECIKKSDCPCEYGGDIYNAGGERSTACETCTCNSGIWECTQRDTCPRRCRVEEGTHISTFDGKSYNLRKDCTYIAVQGDSWRVTIQLDLCHEATQHICLRRVVFSRNQIAYAFNNNGDVTLNEEEIALPLKGDGTTIFKQSSHFIQFETTHGLKIQIQISPIMQLYISLPNNHDESLKGLCGNFNGNADDDFTTPQNAVESSHLIFAASWATGSECKPDKETQTCISSESEYYSKEHCSLLKRNDNILAQCHHTVDYTKYYQMCKISTCNCLNIDHCICAALGSYVHACAARGLILNNWAGGICNETCENNQVFGNNMTACNRNCRFLSNNDFTCNVQDTPVYGCGCPEGKYMNQNGFCVDREDCSCYYKGVYIQPGETIDNCYCESGLIICSEVTTTVALEVCKGGKELLHCPASGSPARCGKKCRNLDLGCPDKCVPECICPEGKAEDDDGNCVSPENCPCSLEGISYAKGEVIEDNCKKCTCQGGRWNCTEKPCPKTCQVYGEGHYITFDDLRFKFDGNCEYIFIGDHCNGETGTFQVLIESVPCCENGVTCERKVKIINEGEVLILEEGKVKEFFGNSSSICLDSYSVHTIGLYLSITFPNGINVIWDKHTKLSVTLDQLWKGKVCGLCGNFNGKTDDDLRTKSNVGASNFIEFGNSWKTAESCPSSLNQSFPCEDNPFCAAWAEKKCSIIKNVDGLFQQCHNKVDPDPYYKACLEEACACDKEGKYLGFCTAVAAYAEACNQVGVCVRWRTPERCPVYCDYYNGGNECTWHYQPCGTFTVKTCSEHALRKQLSTFLEGCYPRCPETAPYLDENNMKCVKQEECTCYFNGQIFKANETIIDCGHCKCIKGKVECEITMTTVTVPTASTTPTTTSTTTTTTTPTTISTTTTTTTTASTTPSTTSSTTTSTPSTTPTTTPSTTSTTTTISTTPSTTPSTTTTTTTTTSPTTTPIPCAGYWTGWENSNKPNETSRGDQESPEGLCNPNDRPDSIQCQSVRSPNKPISETNNTVTCGLPEGLKCIPSSNEFRCSDYRIRVCCIPSEETTTASTTTTTSTPSTTSTTTTTSTTPSSTPTTTPSTTTTTTTTITSPTTTPIPCAGYWTGWENSNKPNETSRGDQESPEGLCNPSDRPDNIQCQSVRSPNKPISETNNTVTCGLPEGLRCIPSSNEFRCSDYRIRVCCIPSEETTTASTTTTTSTPSTTSTTTATSTTPSSTPTTTPSTTTTTTTTITSPTTTPIPCAGYWTGWENSNKPNETSRGDQESPDDLCNPNDRPDNIQCQSVTSPNKPISETNNTVTCGLPEGLKCIPSSNEFRCSDYRIRVCCIPSEETTTASTTTTTSTPSTTSTTTTTSTTPSSTPTTTPSTTTTTTTTTTTITSPTTTPIPCAGYWTGWENSNKPNETSRGDQESPEGLCNPNDRPDNIQCQSVTSPNKPISETNNTVTCGLPEGLRCIPSSNEFRCSDYRIRVCCIPSEETTTASTTTTTSTPSTTSTTTTTSTTPSSTPTTTPSTTTTTTTTITSPTTTPIPCAGYWTGWENSNKPNVISRGDQESPEGLCNPNDRPNNIQCQSVRSPNKPISETDNNVTCGLSEGLTCIPSSNEFMCSDYRIRVCCVPSSTPSDSTTTVSTLTTTTPTTSSTTVSTTTSTTSPTTTTITTTVSTTPTTTTTTTPTTTSTTGSTSTLTATPTTISSTTPTIPCPCKVNKEQKCTGTWTEDCTIKRCDNGTTVTVTRCGNEKPKCENNLTPIEVINECGCPGWECGCECKVYGDPHFVTFNQLYYDFYKDCTYILMEERKPKHNLRVLVDNYFCIPYVPFSCPKGLLIFYNNVNLTISTHEGNVLTYDGIKTGIPHASDGIMINKMPNGGVKIYFTAIQATIIARRFNFKISVPGKHFFENTQGQCGTCTDVPDDDCTRPNGTKEATDCCATTALDWKYDDPNKPQCKTAPTDESCIKPTATPTPCSPPEPYCETISTNIFKNCPEDRLKPYYQSCVTDYCLTKNSSIICSAIESAAESCNKDTDTCVDWRSTLDICKMECKENFVYKACVRKSDDYCEDNTVITGEDLLTYEEGCYCPSGMMRSKDKTKCVSSCCQDRDGNQRKLHEVWTYENDNCTFYNCTKRGIIQTVKTCPTTTSCQESDKIWDDDHCCYTCAPRGTCKQISKTIPITKVVNGTTYTAKVEMNICQGNCPGVTEYNPKTDTIDHQCECCQETQTERKSVDLSSQDGTSIISYSYTHIKSCGCKKNICPELAHF